MKSDWCKENIIYLPLVLIGFIIFVVVAILTFIIQGTIWLTWGMYLRLRDTPKAWDLGVRFRIWVYVSSTKILKFLNPKYLWNLFVSKH